MTLEEALLQGGEMEIIKILKKQGGVKLFKQYWKGGAFFTAVVEFFLLGKNKTGLEILRLSATLKIKQKLEKKYKKCLIKFDREFEEKKHNMSNKIWICWFQGMDNAPDIVRKCCESVKRNNPDKEIIIITSENLYNYIKFPDYIKEKWEKGIITNTHMTDLLRLELLIQYGGTWIDATVFCSSNKIPSYFFNSDLFFYQLLKPGRDGNGIYVSSWFMSAKTNNKVLMATRKLCYEYWKENNFMWDYFLLHDFISIVLDYYPDEWEKIIPRDNATPHILLLRLFDDYNEEEWNAIKEQTPFHKLSYKFEQDQFDKSGTYYKKIINYFVQ